MTREQQEREALKILAPSPSKRADSQGAISVALGLIDAITPRESRHPKKKALRIALRRYLKSLKHARAAYLALSWDALKGGRVQPNRTHFDDEIKFIESIIADTPTGPPKPSSNRQQLAVQQAASLIYRYGSKPPTQTRDGQWDRLAVVLCGDDSKTLKRHMKACDWIHALHVRPDPGRK